MGRYTGRSHLTVPYYSALTACPVLVEFFLHHGKNMQYNGIQGDQCEKKFRISLSGKAGWVVAQSPVLVTTITLNDYA